MTLRGSLSFFAGLAGMLGAGWLVFPHVLYQQSPQPVQFSHKVHIGTVGAKCNDCHSFREDGSFTGIPPLATCSGCHVSVLGTTEEEKRFVKDYVEPNREIPWHVYTRQPANVHFSHAYHVRLAKIECKQCHADHGTVDKLHPYQEDRISGYSKEIALEMKGCMSCHIERKVADSCLACHK